MPLSRDESSDTRAPLFWLHGFTQTGQSARQFRSILAARREVLTPDLPRHGTAFHVGGSLDEIAEYLVSQMPEGICDLGGYSMGARVALHMALNHPEKVRRLVLLGASYGLSTPEERQRRIERDEALAERIELIGADAFLNEWLSQPMFTELPTDLQELDSRAGQRATSLASSLREAGTGTQRWLFNDLERITAVTLAIAGAHDIPFALRAREIASRIPRGTWTLIPGASHAAHLIQPAWTARIVDNFLFASVNEDATHT